MSLLVLLLFVAACASPPPPPPPPLIAIGTTPERLGAFADGRQQLSVALGIETRPVLDPAVATQSFRFAAVPHASVLALGLGVEPTGAPAAWRAEVVLTRADDTSTTLLDETLEATPQRWNDRRLELAAGELSDATITLRATPQGEPVPDGRRLVWAEPLLLPRVPAARPSVILVSLDTLRTDHVGPRPDGRPSLTPQLDALGAASTVFAHAYAPSTWTLPSHTALLWGRHATILDRARADLKRPLTEAVGPVASLAESFRDAGFVTAAFTGGGWMSPKMGLRPGVGFASGFDRFVAYPVPTAHPGQCVPARFDGDAVFHWATAWIREYAADPFFLFIHTYEPHDRCPFVAPGRLDFDDIATQPERVRALRTYYDTLVGRTDALVGRLRETLAASGLDDRTVLAITSDHGEAFFEHGVGGHGCTVAPWDELARVPLLVHRPGGAPARVDAPVALVQVAPTLRALAGVDGPPADGPPLPGLDIPGGTAPALVHTGCGEHLAVRAGPHKLMTTRSNTEPDRLYDLVADPGERDDLAPSRPDTARALRAAADAYWESGGPPADDEVPDVDPTLREQLRALGYAS
ncbi:MAG: sulfatase [bacterium]|nr:sulfatase [bacterium]